MKHEARTASFANAKGETVPRVNLFLPTHNFVALG